MKGSRPRRLLSRLVPALAVTAGAVVAGVLVRPIPQSPTLEDQIPNERALIAAGLSGVPAPGQPTRPLAVDRVVVDGVHTYIAYHYTIDPGPGFVPTPILTLFDDRGALQSADGDVQCERARTGWPLPSWLPWHPAPAIRCLDREDAALPATARAAVLSLDAQLAPVILPSFPTPPPHLETVHVPLNLSALAHERTSRSPLTATTHGIPIVLSAISNGPAFSYLSFTFQQPVRSIEQAALHSKAGRDVALSSQDAICDDMSCTQIGTFPMQRSGMPMTLVVSRIRRGTSSETVTGPWRFIFTMP